VSSQRAAAAIGIRNGQDQATLAANSRRQQSEIGFGDFAAGNRAANKVLALPSIKQPSLTQAGLTIASGGIAAYNNEQRIKTAKG
jgi:hypothetical protein